MGRAGDRGVWGAGGTAWGGGPVGKSSRLENPDGRAEVTSLKPESVKICLCSTENLENLCTYLLVQIHSKIFLPEFFVCF